MPTTIILVIALASCDICCKSSQSSVCSIVSNRHMSGNKGLDDISSVLLLQMEALQFPGFSLAFVDPVLRKARPNKKRSGDTFSVRMCGVGSIFVTCVLGRSPPPQYLATFDIVPTRWISSIIN